MTFVCQIFCPFEAEHTYNRVLYVFYCDVSFVLVRNAIECLDASSNKHLKQKK